MKSEVHALHIQPKAEATDGHPHIERATDSLKEDHRVIERVLAAVERLSQRPQTVSLEAWEKAVDFIRNFADKCHHLKEEEIFFPALEKHGIPREGGPIGMMLLEHEEARAYVRAMAAAVALARSGKDSEAVRKDLVAHIQPYLRLLRQHIQKEDEVLFEMADGALSPEEQRRLLHQFEEHEAKEIGSGVHEKYLKIAQELEQYGRG